MFFIITVIVGAALSAFQVVVSAQLASIFIDQNTEVEFKVHDSNTGLTTTFFCTSTEPTLTPVPGASNTPIPAASNTPVPAASSTPVPGVTTDPSATPIPAPSNTPITGPSNTPVPNPDDPEGDFPCGIFPNANEGCVAVSYQGWFDDVAGNEDTMSVDYIPKLTHMHYDCSVPAYRPNGKWIDQGMDIPCKFIRYNHITDFNKANSSWYRTAKNSDVYEGPFVANLGKCQNGKYNGVECSSWNIHNIPDSVMNESNEIRMTPNIEFKGYKEGDDEGRHFIAANWQTKSGSRSNDDLIARYWHDLCGTYQRVIVPKFYGFVDGNDSIPIVSGTFQLPFETTGGCGDSFKTFVFLDPKQHTGAEGSQTGVTLLEKEGQFKGSLEWDTTKTTNGVHSVLLINLEGTGEYVSAAGMGLRFNVQN